MLISLSVLPTVLLIVQSVFGLNLHRSKRAPQNLQVKSSYNLNHPPSVESYIPVSVIYDNEEDINVLSKSIQQSETITENNEPSSIDEGTKTSNPQRALEPKALYANHPPTVEDYNPISGAILTDSNEDINAKSVAKLQNNSNKDATSANAKDTPDTKVSSDKLDPKDSSVESADTKLSVDELADSKSSLNESTGINNPSEELTDAKSLSDKSPATESPSGESGNTRSPSNKSNDTNTTVSEIIPKGRSISFENDSTTAKNPTRKRTQRRRLRKENKVTLQPQTINEKTEENTERNAQKELTSRKVDENDNKNDKPARNTNFQRRTQPRDPVVPIVESENYVFAHNGDFHYSYEGGDGTKAFERGELKSVEDGSSGTGVVGGFSYKDKDGNDFSLSYTADENGYRPVGDHLPTPPPIPPAIQRALAYLATKTTPEPITERVNKYN